MKIPLLLLLAVSVVGCGGPTLSVYRRSSPRSIDVKKEASAPVVLFLARRTEAGVVIAAKRASEVKLTRQVHHNASAFHYVHDGNVFLEFLELVTSPAVVVFPAFWEPLYSGDDGPDRKTEYHVSMPVAAINPRQSMRNFDIEQELIADVDLFIDPPTVRKYVVRLPIEGLTVSFRLLDEGGQAVGTGRIVTDIHGRILVLDPTGLAVAAEVEADGKKTIIPVLGPSKFPGQLPVQPTSPERATPPPALDSRPPADASSPPAEPPSPAAPPPSPAGADSSPSETDSPPGETAAPTTDTDESGEKPSERTEAPKKTKPTKKPKKKSKKAKKKPKKSRKGPPKTKTEPPFIP